MTVIRCLSIGFQIGGEFCSNFTTVKGYVYIPMQNIILVDKLGERCIVFICCIWRN